MYKKKVFTSSDYDALVSEEAAWEATLPAGSKIISKTTTTNGDYVCTVIYTEGGM